MSAFVQEIAAPVAIRNGKCWDVYREAERYTPKQMRQEVRRVHTNIEDGGVQAGAMLRCAREKVSLSVDELAQLAGIAAKHVWRIEARGTAQLAARELLQEAYGTLEPTAVKLLTKPFEPRNVVAGLRAARRRRSFEEIAAIVALDHRFIEELEKPEPWLNVMLAGKLLAALKRAGAKPISPHASLAHWYWDCQRYQ